MNWFLSLIEPLWASPRALGAMRALAVVFVGLLLARLIAAGAARLIEHRASAQQTLMLRRLLLYGITAVAVAMGLSELGFDLSVLLGAAGILTVALGFASQTSASNIISGLFLIGEKHFEIGDFIRVGNTDGQVVSIDLMSVKLRTFDNLSVRLPNEMMLKAEIVNLTHYPIRRLDLEVGVAYRSDLAQVRATLARVAEMDPLALDEPAPLFNFYEFGDSALLIRFSVWTAQDNYVHFRSRFREAVKVAFADAGIEIPFPQRVLNASPDGGPMVVQIAPASGTQGDNPAAAADAGR